MSQPASATPVKSKKTAANLIIYALIAFSACIVISLVINGVTTIGRAVGMLPTVTPSLVASTKAPIAVDVTKTTEPPARPTQRPTQTQVSLVPKTPTDAVKSTQPAATITSSQSDIPIESCLRSQTPQTGKVVKVVDGDTIHVLIDGKDYPVRYIGMDTPESTIQHEPFGKEASDKNAELVAGQTVILYRDKSETDQYDRLLRYVFVNQTFVNRELVSTGFAIAKDYSPDTACSSTLHAAELDARAASLGMWAAAAIAQPTAASAATQPVATGGTLTIIEVNKQAEYVIIKNAGPTPVNLAGWNLLSEKGSQSCPLDGTIEPGVTLQIWAQTGSGGFNCNFAKTIWNNSGNDPAVLFNPQGQEVSRY